MDNLLIILIFSVVILGLIFAVVLLVKKLKKQTARADEADAHAREEIANAAANAEARIQEEKQRSAEALRKQSEFIESRREVLSAQEDKDLLVDILLAIGGYAGRIERLEEKLGTEQIQSRISSLSSDMESLLNRVTEDLQSQLEETQNIIQDQLSESDIVSSLSDVDSQLDSLKSRLGNLEDELDDVKEKLFDGYYGYDSIAYHVEKIHDAVSCSNDTDIKDKLDSISSDIYWLKSAVDDAKTAAEEAKSAIESK